MNSTSSNKSTAIAEFFQENGYYHARGVFTPAEVRELEIDFDAIVAQLTGSEDEVNARWKGGAMEKISPRNDVVLHTHNVQKYSARWLGALRQPRFLEVCTALLGPDVVLHHSKLFQKPAEKGAPFPMHQDWSYFPTVRDTMLAGIIHISDATDEMGCLRVVPGSHKLGRIEKSDGQSDAAFSERFPLDAGLPVEAKAGDVVFFHYFTAHGSKPNRSSSVRKTVLTQLYSGRDEMEATNKSSNERLVLAGRNYHISRSTASATA